MPRAGRYANFANLEEINFEPKLIVEKCIRVRKQTSKAVAVTLGEGCVLTRLPRSKTKRKRFRDLKCSPI